ncbi:MAG: hypothetical protein E7470_06455 [Ruminococcaceae bacterium]|nr:hypothetical protein [Oscillospiraceae bacterium]
MKKASCFKRLIVAMISIVMLLAVISITASAAKENFQTCDSIGIRNCAVPVVGEHPDFDVTPYSPGQYEIKSVNWYEGSVATQNRMSETSIFERGMVYIVEFEVWAKDDDTFTTDSNGYTTVTANVGTGAGNGEYSANVYNVAGKTNTKYLTVRCTFSAAKPQVINTVTITDILEPYAGDKVSKEYYASTITSVSTYYGYGDATIGQYLYWYDGGRQMSSNDTFVEGKTYTVQLVLAHNVGYEFAVDPNHILASPGKPFTAVCATINGKTATVIPDYTRGTADSHIVVAAQFVCKPSRQITHVDIKDVTAPKTGEEPKYYISCADESYDRLDFSSYFYAYGVAWLDSQDNIIKQNEHIFQPSTSYTVSITLKPTGDYIFAADEYDRPLVTATVNGKEAEVQKSTLADGCITVTYKFRKTESLELSKVEVQDIDPPKDGAFPDYTMTLGDTTYAPFYTSDDDVTKNSIQWFDLTTNKYMKVGVDKFIGGHEYAVFIYLKTTGGYTFKCDPDTGEYSVSAKINGKTAVLDACTEDQIDLRYDFTCDIPEHVCNPVKVAEVKATCSEPGKKAYYSCEECGKCFEDFQGTNRITNINTWGTIAKLAHTGGTATCMEPAKCSLCGAPYGKVGSHIYGTEWGYTASRGHAHACTVTGCDAHDTIEKHTPGPEATETSDQVCTVCNYIIKPKLSHKHNLTKMEKVDATCTANGKKAYYYCDSCDGIFGNIKGSEEIMDTDELIIPATGHKDSRWKSDGNVHWKECTVEGCGVVTVEKEAHEFNKAGRCQICKFSPDGETEATEETDPTEGMEATDPDDDGGSTATTAPGTTDETDPSDGGADPAGLWITLIVVGVLVAGGIAAAAVVLIKKHKKPEEAAE